VIHAYAAGSEPWEPWAKFAGADGMEGDDTKGNAEYQALKEERAAAIFEVRIYRYIPLYIYT